MCILEMHPCTPRGYGVPGATTAVFFSFCGVITAYSPSKIFFFLAYFPVEFLYFKSAGAWATLSGLSNPIYDPITLKLATTWLSAPDPEYLGWCVCFVEQEISQTVTFPQMFIIPRDVYKPGVALRHEMISERLRETWEVINSEATALWC